MSEPTQTSTRRPESSTSERVATLEERMANWHRSNSEKLDAILVQTTKHNGRMVTIEGRVDELESYKDKMYWVRWAGWLFGTVLAGLLVSFIVASHQPEPVKRESTFDKMGRDGKEYHCVYTESGEYFCKPEDEVLGSRPARGK